MAGSYSVQHRLFLGASCAVALVIVAAGCGDRPAPRKLTADKLASYASLPLARRASNRDLQAELARLEAERATPEALARPADSAVLTSANRPTRDSRRRSTTALVKLLSPLRRRQLIEQLNREFPRATLDLDESNRAVYAQLAERWSTFRIDAETMMARSDFGLDVPIDQGLLADLTIVDVARAIIRLECLVAVVSLQEDDLPQALVAWEVGGRLLGELASLPHAVTRAAAARARIEWARTGQTILHSPLAHRGTVNIMLLVLDRHLDHWPDDRAALIGDRAVGLHTYELLRDGYWMSLLTTSELRELRRKNLVDALMVHVATKLDEDELFYLRAMRRLIDAAEQPYYERQEVMKEIEHEIQSLGGKPEYPWFAAEYLLPDLPSLQRWQAADREIVEALRATMHVALGQHAPTKLRSPLTGKPMRWRRRGDVVELESVQWTIDETAVQLPVFGAEPSTGQR